MTMLPPPSEMVAVPLAVAEALLEPGPVVAVLRASEAAGGSPTLSRYGRDYVLARLRARGAFLAGETARRFNFGLCSKDSDEKLIFVQTARDTKAPM